MSMLNVVNKNEVLENLVGLMNEKSTRVFLSINMENLEVCILEDDCLSNKMKDDRIIKMITETVNKSNLVGIEITEEFMTITTNDGLYTTKYDINIRG